MLYLGALALSALLAASAAALIRPTRARSVTALLLSLGWLLLNDRWEGPVLWVPVAGHGLTLGDLLTPAVVIALGTRQATRRHCEA